MLGVDVDQWGLRETRKRNGEMNGMLVILLALSSLLTSIALVKTRADLHATEIVYEDASRSIVSVESDPMVGRGTGFVVKAESGQKFVITNAHVCELGLKSGYMVGYVRKDGEFRTPLEHKLEVIKQYDNHDLCILKLHDDLPALPLADDVHVNERVQIIGYPVFNLLSASHGHVRGYAEIKTQWEVPMERCVGKAFRKMPMGFKADAAGKIITIEACIFKQDFLMTDALGDAGQSGSPALNEQGEIIGVMSMVIGKYRVFALLVPLNDLRAFLSKY